MLKNYFKIALRNLYKSKVYTLINVFGLSIGMACVILIVLFLKDELSYDRFHEGAEDIYRVAWFSGNPQTRTPHPMAQALVDDFPEVESAVSLSPLWGPGLTKRTFSVYNPENNIRYDEERVLSVDSTFFDVFSFALTKGNPQKILREVGGLVISESIAEKYFKDEDPLGKRLAINNDQNMLEVTGVFKDVPENAHFHFDFLISYVTLKAMGPDNPYYTWADFGHFNYIRLQPGADAKTLEDQMLEWSTQYTKFTAEQMEFITANDYRFKLQPITDIHLKSQIRWELEANGNIEYIYIMSAAALFILIIACVNFMNITTAKSAERAKEIGIRKSIGATRGQLSKQFIGESVIISVLAVVVAGLIVEIALPSFNVFTGKSLSLSYLRQPFNLMILLGSGLTVGLLSGLYPAAYLSSMESSHVLKGRFVSSPKGIAMRKALVIFQFAISMVLITGGIIIYNQLNYINTKDLGFDKEAVVSIPIKSSDFMNKFETLKTELTALPNVESVSAASNIPGRQFNQNPVYLASDEQIRTDLSECFADYDLFETLGIEIIEGRGFSRDFSSDTITSFIINQTAAEQLQLEDPVGKEIVRDADGNLIRGTIIGVARDFHFQSLHEPVRPLIFQSLSAYNHTLVKVKTQDLSATLTAVEGVWKQFDKNFEFEYEFLDEMIEQQYRAEQKMAGVFSGFSILAAIIACLGLLGLAMLNFRYKMKEVGIRKVFGASTSGLMVLLIKDFTRLVAVAIILAVPLAWAVMNNWLENFTFRISINPLIFLLTGGIVLLLSWLTLGYLTFNAASSNPTSILRND
ncbi:MAG: ABC transporter permease [Bacteroidota bacterium]